MLMLFVQEQFENHCRASIANRIILWYLRQHDYHWYSYYPVTRCVMCMKIVNADFLEEISDGVVAKRPWLYRKYESLGTFTQHESSSVTKGLMAWNAFDGYRIGGLRYGRMAINTETLTTGRYLTNWFFCDICKHVFLMRMRAL